jgi:hypothetical protein
MTMQIRMTAIRENEIVTLRGGACLVGAIAKIAIDCQKSPKLKSKTLNPKVEKPIFISLRGPKALDDKGHEGTQRQTRTTQTRKTRRRPNPSGKRELQSQQMNADGNNAEQDGLAVRFQPISRHRWPISYVPIWEMLRGGETHG